MRKWLKNTIAIGIGICIALLLCEIVLRIYNPFKTRVRGNEIELPANITYEFKDVSIHGLDKHIIHHKNSLGFRGPEPRSSTIQIFCVGGSTTECFYLSDGKDWPALLMQKMRDNGTDAWINNAGLDGHSTRGHIILLRDQILPKKPMAVIFLVGCNDIAADGLNKFEHYHLKSEQRFLQHFELFNLYNGWRMSRNAAKAGLGHKPVNFKTWPEADTSGWNYWNIEYEGKVREDIRRYIARIDTLNTLCRKAHAVPVFITQPSMLGPYTDPASGRYLGDLKFQEKSALHYHRILDAYNQALIKYANEKNSPVIDAAALFSHSSDDFYDFFHYTNAGAEKMAQIVFDDWAHSVKY